MTVDYVYRLDSPILGIRSIDGQHIPVMVPRGALLKVVRGPLNGKQLVDCLWDGTQVMLSGIDIRERGTPVVRRVA
jgi:hypothetical protein